MNSLEVIDPDLRHFVEDAHGLTPTIFYVMSFFEAEDGSARWMPRRAYTPVGTRSLYLPEAGRDEDFAHAPEAKMAYTGPVQHAEETGRWTVSAPDGSSCLDTTPTFLTWTESDVVAVAGTSVGPACRLRLEDPDYPMLYTTRPFRMAGTVKGIPVRGASLLVTIHMPEGRDVLASPLLSWLQIAWIEFVNEYDDGSFENGLLVWGREGLAGLAVGRRDGAPIVESDVAVRIENDGGDPEFPCRIQFSGGGETLVWEPLHRGGRWPARHDMPDRYRFRQGVVRREGAPGVVASYAFAETFQDRMEP
jgi:hypothetical protein